MSVTQRVLLSSSSNTDDCSYDPYEGLTDTVSHHDSDEAFNHIYYVMLFIATLWFVGKIFQRIGMPALVGEIITGIIMGPELLDLVGDHGSEFLVVIGEIALIMLVVEAGIDVDIGMLKLIGPRGLAIAVLGSIIPLVLGLCISIAMGQGIQASIAIGSCFAPTSMGIALNVLKKAKILNTPTGQLIIAAAILDDVIALIILSELTAMNEPTAKNIVLPLVISPILILGVGYLSIRIIPKVIKNIMAKIPKQHHENGILTLLFLSTFVLIPACHWAGSSHLLGAFLSGLMFCTDHTIHHVWSHQIKRILYWMLRIFFACTIGFEIPIKEFTNGDVIARGLIYCICAVGKIVTGFFGRPLTKKEFLTIGFSMSAWGEFAFIIATASYEEGTIDKESFSAVLLAVLLSVIISPYCLRLTLVHFEKQMHRRMDKNLKKYGDTNAHPVYFAINTKARGRWGHQDKILHRIFQLNLEIIDFRSWHAPEYNYSHHQPLTKESFYVMDQNLALPPTKHIDAEQKLRLKDRVSDIRTSFKECLGEKAVVNIKRWLPGVLKNEDNFDKKDAVFGQHVSKNPKRPSYCRREAFRQAHSIMSSIDLDVTKSLVRKDRDDKTNQNNGFLDSPPSGHPLDMDDKSGRKRSASLPDTPDQLDHAQSVPARPNSAQLKPRVPPAKVHFHKIQLVRHLSTPENEMYHSGAGHGGQAKGAGALPFTNKMINIHDHFEERRQSEQSEQSPSPREQKDEDSTSYIYGDEDADHHKLPQYQTPTRNHGNKRQFRDYYHHKPMPIKEHTEDSLHGTPMYNTEEDEHDHGEIEVVTATNGQNGQNGVDVNGDPMIELGTSDEDERDDIGDVTTDGGVLTDGGLTDDQYRSHKGSLAITITPMEETPTHHPIRGNYPDSKMSIASHSTTLGTLAGSFGARKHTDL